MNSSSMIIGERFDRHVLTGMFLLAIFLFAFNQFADSDSFYHLKAGQVIWETQSIPNEDPFSYTAPGAPWVTHEWLAQLAFYGIYRLGGYWGVMAFVAALAALTYLLILRLALRKGAHPYLAPPLLFAFAYLTFEFWIPRPQIFSYLLAAGLLYSLELYREAGDRKHLWHAAGIVWIWANVSASVLLAFAMGFAYLAGSFFGGRPAMRKDMALFLGGSLGLSLANPNGLETLFYAATIAPAASELRLFEWQSIWNFRHTVRAQAFFLEFLAGGLFLIGWFGVRKESRDFTLLALILGVSIMPFISVRHMAYWPLLLAYPFTVGVSAALARHVGRVRYETLWWALVLAGALFVGVRALNFPATYFKEAWVPVHAADFIEAQGIRGPRFNLYNEGGYLIWRFWPKDKVFIDGRSETYPSSTIQELYDVIGRGAAWSDLVDRKYGVNHFLIAYQPEALYESVKPLVHTLMERNWVLVYWDDAALIFVRNTEEHRNVIEQYGLRHVSPYRAPEDIGPEERKEALIELERLLAVAPHSRVLHAYAVTVFGAERNRDVILK